MFVNENEEKFFFMSIDKAHKVLEYGSGQSTIEIAEKCNSVVSIEHQEDWYNKNIGSIPTNCELILKKPTLPYIEGGHCGTYEEFKDYIEAPIDKGPFDIIFIDGRARVSCGSVCHKMAHENTIIFIHDFHRPEYNEVLNYLDLIDTVDTMAKFKVKR